MEPKEKKHARKKGCGVEREFIENCAKRQVVEKVMFEAQHLGEHEGQRGGCVDARMACSKVLGKKRTWQVGDAARRLGAWGLGTAERARRRERSEVGVVTGTTVCELGHSFPCRALKSGVREQAWVSCRIPPAASEHMVAGG